MIKLKSMVFFTKYVVKTEISIYLMAFLNKKKLSKSGSGNARNFYSPLFTREKSCMVKNESFVA